MPVTLTCSGCRAPQLSISASSRSKRVPGLGTGLHVVVVVVVGVEEGGEAEAWLGRSSEVRAKSSGASQAATFILILLPGRHKNDDERYWPLLLLLLLLPRLRLATTEQGKEQRAGRPRVGVRCALTQHQGQGCEDEGDEEEEGEGVPPWIAAAGIVGRWEEPPAPQTPGLGAYACALMKRTNPHHEG